MKKLLATILALVMALSLCSVAWAAGEYDPLPDAVNGTITLTEDVTFSGDATLNLTGKTVETKGYTIIVASGTVSITGGTFVNEVEGVITEGSKDPHGILAVNAGATLNITSASLETAAYQPLTVEGTCNSVGTTYKCTVPNNKYDSRVMIFVDGSSAHLNMPSGSVEMVASKVASASDGMYGIYASKGGKVTVGDAATGTGPSVHSQFAALGNNHDTSPSVWNIYGGEYVSAAKATNNERWKYFCGALYLPATTEIHIYGGTFKGGNYAVCMPWADAGTDVDISGGTFSTDNGDGLFYYRSNTAAETTTHPDVTITGGKYNGTLVVGDVQNPAMNVSGGTYTTDVSNYVDSQPVAKRNNGEYVVGASAVVSAANTDGSITIVEGNDAQLNGVNSGVKVVVTGGVVSVNGTRVTNDDVNGYTVPTRSYYYYPATDTKKDETKGSPKTFDAGVGIYAATALLSVGGMAWVGKKRG